jgi:hypothetical protein
MIPKTMQDELTNMNTEQLSELNKLVVALITSKRRADTYFKKASLRVGDKVSWTGKNGYREGTLTKINRTRCKVKEHMPHTTYGFTTWNIPISMLTVVEEEPSFNPLTGEWS